MGGFYEGSPNAALSGAGGHPLAQALDCRDRKTTPYFKYEGTVASATVFDAYTDLGFTGENGGATRGYIKNDDAVISITAQFSVDGTNYGPAITIKATEKFDMSQFFLFRKIKLTPASGSPAYRIWVA